MPHAEETITGRLTYIIRKTEDGQITARLKLFGGGTALVCGSGLPDMLGILYDYTGCWSASEGKNAFFADSAAPSSKEDGNETVAWIAGVFKGKGIGPAMARRIVDTFGPDAEHIVREHTERLAEVKGISSAKAADLKKILRESGPLDRLSALLSPYGFSASQCATLVTKLGDEAEDKIKENPYLTIRCCHSSFEEADILATGLGIAKDSETRLKACSVHIFGQRYAGGDTMVNSESWIAQMMRLTGCTRQKIRDYGMDLISRSILRCRIMNDGKQYLYTVTQAGIENAIANTAIKLSERKGIQGDIRGQVEAYTEISGLKLDSIQMSAAVNALSSGFSIITGGPGTGKTTIMKVIAGTYEASGSGKAILLATTGRAARRLSESTDMPASTIHHFFNIFDMEDRNESTELPPVENSLVIVDEASMMDTDVASILFSKIGKGSLLLLVGDTDQLPSVGPGAILRDLIAPGLFSTTVLRKVYRTDSRTIYENTLSVNAGICDLKQDDTFHLHKESDEENIKRVIGKIYMRRAYVYGLSNVNLLLPYRKGSLGVDEMNRYIQSLVNPHREGVPEVSRGQNIFRPGDPVMHTAGNSPEISNGDIGKVEECINHDGIKCVKALINGTVFEYSGKDLDGLKLAYACTVHKSQGSEYKAVITCITSHYPAMLYRNIPYVAFSRAKEELDVIYDSGLYEAIKTYRSDGRMTLMPFFLASLTGQMVGVAESRPGADR